MAVIHTEKRRLNLAVPIVVAAAVAAGTGIWWYQQSSMPTAVTPVAPVTASSAQSYTPNQGAPAPSPIEAAPSPQLIEKLVDEQKQTAKAIEEQPQLKPIKGPVTERPSFITEMEWSIFKSVSMQQPDPDKALTALINKVRFFKQLEVLQDLPPTAAQNKRQSLATELLDDLPERLRNGDYDQVGATQLLDQLVTSAEPDPNKRKALSMKHARLLQQVQAQLAQAASAASAEKQAATGTK